MQLICPGYASDTYNQQPHQCDLTRFYFFSAGRAKPNKIRRSYQCRSCANARSRDYWRTRYYPEHRQKQISAVVKRRKKTRKAVARRDAKVTKLIQAAPSKWVGMTRTLVAKKS